MTASAPFTQETAPDPPAASGPPGPARRPPGPYGGPRRFRFRPPMWEFGDLLIRRYHPADLDTVLMLHRAGLAQVGLRPGDGVYYEYDLFRMRELYLRDDGEFLVGVRDTGRLVAMGGLRRFPGAGTVTGELVRLRVRSDAQRLGYGSAVVLALEERARELGYRMLRADTTEYQQPALSLYRGFGWSEHRRETVNGIVNIHIEKPLG